MRRSQQTPALGSGSSSGYSCCPHLVTAEVKNISEHPDRCIDKSLALPMSTHQQQSGLTVLRDPVVNRGLGFSAEERKQHRAFLLHAVLRAQ